MVKKKLLTAAFMLCSALALPLGAQALTIEQANAAPPEFSVYFYDTEAELSGLDASDISAYYDGAPMSVVGIGKANEAEAGVHYIYALDISASIPKSVFNASKAAVLEAFDKLRANETLSLVTFGDSVEVVISQGQSREEIEAVLDSLLANNKNTDFNGAISRITELAGQSEGGRKIGIIFSDGVDDIYAGFTRNELEEKLRSGGLSINAMCINGSASAAVSQFGEFVRLSGGEIFLYNAGDCSQKLASLLERLDSCYVLSLQASTNIIDGKSHTISFKLGDLPVQTVDVTPRVSLPDETAPKVLDISYDPEQTALKITFSEPVAGASELGSYAVTFGGTTLKPVSVKYSEDSGEPAALLRLDATPYEGEYTVAFSGISDISMEKNPLETALIKVNLSTGIKMFPKWAYYAIGSGVLLVIVLVFVLIALKNKKQKLETEKRLSEIENRPGHVAEGAETKNQIIIPKAQGVKVQLAIFDGKGKKYNVTQDIVTSLFIGKHSGNDLVIEDSRISRQHAVIEKMENAAAIQDLNSTNGTFVNGVRIQPGVSQRIAKDDEITLGDTTVRIIDIG